MSRVIFAVVLSALMPATYGAGVLDQLDALSAGQHPPKREFLPPDEAFMLAHDETPDHLNLRFAIAPKYYLYRDRMKFEALSPGLTLGTPALPASETKHDPEFGQVQIYRGDTQISVPITADTAGGRLRVTYQGCAEDGICYPPIKKEFSLGTVAAALPTGGSLTDLIAGDLATQRFAHTLLWFFLAGLALALTPCVFPMVPILSGIIVGQRQPISAMRSFSLAFVYVLAMAGTYALVGVAAGLFGRNLQAVFQQPGVIVGFSLIFVALALSMFGLFTLQVPGFIQSRAAATSRTQTSGSWLGVAIMGALSAVIVGPCVAPPLAAALLYLGHQGSPLVGGAALFALGLGMGAPLLVIGASAGRWLPRAGAWMESVKRAFGVIFLGLAIWFLERLLPPATTLALWAVLLIGSASYLGALDSLQETASGWQRFWKGIGLTLLCYGVVLLVGAAAGADNPLRPLAPLTAARVASAMPTPSFAAVKGTTQFDLAVAAAGAEGKPVLVDFYADWCIECKRLERNTFSDPGIRAVLKNFVLLRADVTAADSADTALLKRFELHGPPAVLFFNVQGQELRSQRLVGYLAPTAFGALLSAAYPP